MKLSDRYHMWVEWSEEDAAYLGKCPDLITGIHGDDPVKVYSDLHEVVEDVIRHFEAEGRTLPYRTPEVSLGSPRLPNLDNIGDVLALAEGEDHR